MGCHPVKNVLFILLSRISKFLSQIQLICVIRNGCASGNILLECYPLLRRCLECRDVRHWFLNLNRTRILFTQSTFFSECYPPLYILCKNCVTFKIFKQTTDQLNYRKLTWGILKSNVFAKTKNLLDAIFSSQGKTCIMFSLIVCVMASTFIQSTGFNKIMY